MAIETKEVLEKIEEFGKAVIHCQETCTKLEKQHDGIDFDSMQKAADAGAKAFEDIQKLRTEIKADELTERLFGIEKAVAGFNASNDDETPAEHKNAFYAYLRKGKEIPQETIQYFCEKATEKTLFCSNSENEAAYTKALVEGSNPDGGFFVTPERSSQIITRIFETSPIRSIASVVSTSSNEMEFPLDDDEAVATAVGEVEARPTTDTPEIGLVTIPVHEYYAKPKASQRMLDDSGFDIEGWLQRKVTSKISRKENTDFVVGNGSKKAKGFLTYDAWTAAGVYQRDAIEQITSTGTSALLDESDDLITLQNSLIEDYQAGAVFGGRRTTFSAIMKLKDGNGQYLLNPFMMKQGTDKILLGQPFVIMADMPVIAASSLSLIYGDFAEGYTIVDRFGIRVLRDPYSAKPYIEFYTTKRTGAAVTNYEALKIMITKA
jgi:HK97 family phage major capsid protein